MFFYALCILFCSLFINASKRTLSYFTDLSLPQVPTLFGGYDNGLLYVLNPCAFLSRCMQRYGSVYRVSLGHRRLIVVSAGSTIKSVFAASANILSNDIIHKEMFYIVAGITANFDYLHHVMARNLFPLVDRSLSPNSLAQTTESFGPVLLSKIKEFVQSQSGPISITRLTNEPFYAATNLILLGPAFPSGTYEDFRTLSQSVPYRFSGTLLWFFPSDAARRRLLKVLTGYLKRDVDAHEKDKFSSAFMRAFEEHGIQSMEGAKLMLNFLWGVHSNTHSNSLLLLSFLLHDSDALFRVRAEIDRAVERFGSLEALLEAGPDALDDPSFELLTSAINETLRLTTLHAGIRQAVQDFELRVEDRVIAVEKGEYIFGDARTSHMDPSVYPNPEKFVVDRFMQQPYRKRQLQTEKYVFHSLGGGKHRCKGRWLALYQIKVHMIILLRMFDFTPAEEGASWRLLQVHPRSIGVVHTEDDFLVRLTPRQLEGGQ